MPARLRTASLSAHPTELRLINMVVDRHALSLQEFKFLKDSDIDGDMIDAEEHVYDDDPRIGHPDVRTLLKDVSYFFLGNGRMQAAVQFAPSGEGTPVGLLVMDPERLGKKREALSFDPETGLESTMVRIRVGGTEFVPTGGGMEAAWSLRQGVPMVRVKWRAGGIEVVEEFFCPNAEEPVLAREVTLTNRGGHLTGISLETGLRKMTSVRKLELDTGAHASTFVLYHSAPDRQRVSFHLAEEAPINTDAQAYWARTARAHFDSPMLDRYFDAARFQLPAVVSAAGRVDASIWQYNREWVRDHAWIAVGLVLSGQHEKAGVLLRRLLRDFVTGQGDTIDSSERRHPDEVELDQNGELLYALDQYTRWTGDPGIVREHWDRVEALAEFPLQDVFRHPASGLLANVREYWERHRIHGIEPGLELAYQMFVSLGLGSAAGLARLLGRESQADRWTLESGRLHRAVFEDPGFGFVEKGRICKRRGLKGELCERIQPLPAAGLPTDTPLAMSGDHFIEPDTTAALPVAFGAIDAGSDLAVDTLEGLEMLWDQAWTGGGYGRYHCSSEPDAWGPWPFPSLFVARACAETGRFDRVWRILRWLDTMPGACSGTWFEFYGEAHAPPFAQIGLTPWTWAEMMLLLVSHVMGVRPEHDRLRLRPRLLPGLERIRASFPLRGGSLEITVQTKGHDGPLSIDSNARVLKAGTDYAELAYTDGDLRVDLSV